MADFFNKLLSNFCSTFMSKSSPQDLTIHGTGLDTTMANLENYTKNDVTLFNREMDIMTPLWNALGLKIPDDVNEQMNRAEKIKICLDNLAKHRLIIGSVFVGVGTAKYWKKMSQHCMNNIIGSLKEGQKKVKLFKDGIDDIQKRLSDNFKNMGGKNKDQHNKDAQDILDSWNSIIGSNGANITFMYHLSPKDFQSMYTIISTMVKPSNSLYKLVMNNGKNTAENIYFNLLSAIKDVQRNWNSYKN